MCALHAVPESAVESKADLRLPCGKGTVSSAQHVPEIYLFIIDPSWAWGEPSQQTAQAQTITSATTYYRPRLARLSVRPRLADDAIRPEPRRASPHAL